MKEAIGSGYLLSFIVTLIGVMIVIVVSSINYTKTFKVKNKMIDIIEENYGYNESTETEIETFLGEAGYKVSAGTDTDNNCKNKVMKKICDKINGCSNNNINSKLEYVSEGSQYDYCVIKVLDSSSNYYYVTTYMYYDLPVVGNMIKISVSGTTTRQSLLTRS
jgi:hypothetical protein